MFCSLPLFSTYSLARANRKGGLWGFARADIQFLFFTLRIFCSDPFPRSDSYPPPPLSAFFVCSLAFEMESQLGSRWVDAGWDQKPDLARKKRRAAHFATAATRLAATPFRSLPPQKQKKVDETELETCCWGITQLNWEDAILWDDSCDEIPEEGFVRRLPPFADLDAFGLATPPGAPREQGRVNRFGQLPEIPVAFKAPEASKLSLFHPSAYREIENGKWLDSIIWDDEQPPFVVTDLVLDVNDRNMIFEPLQKDVLVQKKEERWQRQLQNDRLYNPYNISCDRFYVSGRVNRVVMQPRHAQISVAMDERFYPYLLTEEELRNWHRPKLNLSISPCVGETKRTETKCPTSEPLSSDSDSDDDDPFGCVTWHPCKKQVSRDDDIKFRLATESSARPTVVLLEYIEQHPLLLQRVGMASTITHYARPAHAQPGDYVLSESEAGPFMGEVRTRQTGIENSLFVAPLFWHPSASSPSSPASKRPLSKQKTQPHVDFLMVRSATTGKWTLREIEGVYAVGQQQPKIEVPIPNSKHARALVQCKMRLLLQRLFQQHEVVAEDQLTSVFGPATHTALHQVLSKCALRIKNTKKERQLQKCKTAYKKNPDYEFPSVVCTPEQFCAHDSMLAGIWRMRDSLVCGLPHPTCYSRILLRIHPRTHPQLLQVATYVHKQVQTAPWYQTRAFLAARSKNYMTLSGRGNPLGRGHGFSYVELPVHAYKKTQLRNAPPKRQLRIDTETQPIIKPGKVTGSESDLRKLSIPQMQQHLRKLGVPECETKCLAR